MPVFGLQRLRIGGTNKNRAWANYFSLRDKCLCQRERFSCSLRPDDCISRFYVLGEIDGHV